MSITMYAPVNDNYAQIIDRNVTEYPNFMNFILPIESFDPFQSTELFSHHLYDDLDHPLFNHYLQKVLTRPKANNDVYKKVDPFTFQQRNETLIVKILQVLFEQSTITTKWEYVLRDFFITHIFSNEKNNLLNIYIKCCLHRPSRAYGKVVDLQFIYNMKEDDIDVLQFKLTGVVPQQYISFIHGINENIPKIETTFVKSKH